MINPITGIKHFFELQNVIIGINRRNQDFVRALNSQDAKKIVDDKLLTKRLLKKNGLPVPQVYSILRDEEEVYNIAPDDLPKTFVIKPRKGRRGQGIKVFFGKKKNMPVWIASEGTYDLRSIQKHLIRILTGQFSLGTRKYDVAFLEERLKIHPVFKPYVYKGVPDIRIIIYKGVPVMAMTRLPTKESRGTANLHTGAISVGIDMRLGVTTTAIQRRGINILGDVYDILDHIPDKPYLKLSGIKIPYWKKILLYASEAAKVVGLGYCGVDIVIDRDKGPVILEINARPGLGIQMANTAGLLERIRQLPKKKVKSPARAVELGMTLFGGEVMEEIEAIIGKQVIGVVEEITLLPPKNLLDAIKEKRKILGKKRLKLPNAVTVRAKIDTGAYLSSIDIKLAQNLGFDFSAVSDILKLRFNSVDEAKKYMANFVEPEALEHLRNMGLYKGLFIVKNANGISLRPRIKIPTLIADEQLNITFTIADRSTLDYPVLLGRKDLKEFLIDPSRKELL